MVASWISEKNTYNSKDLETAVMFGSLWDSYQLPHKSEAFHAPLCLLLRDSTVYHIAEFPSIFFILEILQKLFDRQYTVIFKTFPKTENEIEMHDDSHVTSFMVKKSEEPNQRQSYIVNEPNHRQSYIVNEPNHRKSTPTEKEIEAEPIYCKIQPKDKRKSGTDRSNSTTPTKSEVLSPLKDTSADTDTHYVALYPFVARVDTELTINKGDIILCKECTDKKGWMRGINDSTKYEGWVPATYVQKVEKVEAS
ncbi:intersectin-2-like [Mercenaria mercenaria]|uniref:intersectin-2-like n=1 Tax=Mercenaria mercenaria TaxID=6596 RepID=UPI00234E4A39|nr:intersectin-2-like [Mercenaria mercenaria]